MANISTDFSVWSTTASSNQPDSSDTNTIQADLQAIQAGVKGAFPNVGGAVTPTHTELNYVDGVTSAIQTQINAKAASGANSDITSLTALTNITAAAVTIAADDKVLIQDTSATDQIKTVTIQAIADLVSVADASETVKGIVELATAAEVITGTDTARAVTPASMKAGLNASGNAPIYACRAWVNFNGTGTVSILASGNVSSITDNAVGDYTVNLTTALPDANYAVVAMGARSNTNDDCVIRIAYNVALTSSAVRLKAAASATLGAVDTGSTCVAFFR